MANHPNRHMKKVRISEALMRPGTDELLALGARMSEQIEERENGIVCQRWILPNGAQVIAYGSPEFREYYTLASTRTWIDTISALRVVAGKPAIPTRGTLDEIAPAGIPTVPQS